MNSLLRINRLSVGCVALVMMLFITTSSADAAPRYLLSYYTTMGNYLIEMYDDTPIARTNYLNYVNAGQQDGLLIHRSANTQTAGLNIIQGGGFGYNDPTDQFFFATTTTPIIADQEALHSNVRGTIAMAENELGYTSQWFINVTDNTILDDNDPGSPVGQDNDGLIFVAFGEVIEGMSVVDNIFAQPIVALDPENPISPLNEVPFEDGRNSPPGNGYTPDELIRTSFVVLLGDANFDSTLNATDIDETYSLIGNDLGAANIFNDVDRDGDVTDQQDVDALVREVFQTEYGDTNLDGKVEPADLTLMKLSWLGTGLGWAQGDFTGDGTVGPADLTQMKLHWLFGSGGAGIPEPTSLALIALGGLALLRRRA